MPNLNVAIFVTEINLSRILHANSLCCHNFQLPDEVRKAPTKSNPKVKFEALTGVRVETFNYVL